MPDRFSVGYPVNFYSGGDTTRDAFGKHINEITKIYGILNALDAEKVSASGVTSSITSVTTSLTAHINSTNPHPNWTPTVSWSNVTNKPSLSALSGNLDVSRINGLTTLIDGRINSNSNGITSGSLDDRGYVKFKNGLIVQWGKKSVLLQETWSGNSSFTAGFSIMFPSKCYVVTTGMQVIGVGPRSTKLTITDADYDWTSPAAAGASHVELLNITQSNFTFRLSRSSLKNEWGRLDCNYIAIGK